MTSSSDSIKSNNNGIQPDTLEAAADVQAQTDAAWLKLQEKIAVEPEQPQWREWSQQAATTGLPRTASTAAEVQPPAESATDARTSVARETAAESIVPQKTTFAGWVRRNGKRIGVASAVCVLAATIATPVGNQALAAILGQFRMQQVTEVKEDDLRQFFQTFPRDGITRESINNFGTFSQASGKTTGEAALGEVSKLLGRKVVIPPEVDANKQKIHVMPSQTITFKMNVAEVNKAMRALGAKKLLPESINGKPITLQTGELVNISVNNKQSGYYFTQQPLPVITVDPAIPVAEALDAVLQFPLLPDNLRQSLNATNILKGGAVPLPVITNGQSEKVKVEGTDVIVTVNNLKSAYYTGTWAKDGQMFTLQGDSSMFADRKDLLAKIAELIKL